MGSSYLNNNRSSTTATTSNNTSNNITARPPIPKITRRPPSSLSSVSVHSNDSSILSAARKVKAKPKAPPTASESKQPVNRNPTNLRPAIFHTSTSTRLGLSTGSNRPPLRPRVTQNNNHHANPLTIARPTIASVAKMPPGDHNTRTRPGPQLSAAAARGLNRTPLTPKVAVAAATCSSKGSAAGTPLAGKRQSATSTTGTGTNTPTVAQEDLQGAVAALLASNITPRSGKRQSRVDSSNNTPIDTPNLERSSDALDEATRAVSSLSFESRPSPMADSPESERDSKFFYASDVKSNQLVQNRPVSVPQKPATFFYANNTTATNKRKTTPPTNHSAPTLAPPDSLGTKFFYANGVSDGSPVRPLMPVSGSASTVSSSSRTPNGRPNTSNSTASYPMQRPTSPVKTASLQSGPGLKGSALSPGPPTRPQMTSPPSLTPASTTNGKRRVSIDTTPKVFQRGHSRTGSVPSMEPLKAPPYASPTRMSPEPVSPPLSPGLSHPAMTMATILQAAEDLTDDETASKHGDLPPEPHSPSKSVHDLDGVHELVANARRERKVQDLEITNASLEAINRTLEKQLRKQTAELRRYRRLSRSGKLSIASSRVTSAAHDEPPIKLSELIEDEDETEEEEDLEDSMYDSDPSSEGSDGPDDGAKALKRRKRDERRLQLDLTKHQELLIDSQKINQSIKRCLDWTEVLIRDGQKALAYNVRPSDVDFGGRVLGPTDEDDETSRFIDDASRLDGSEASSPVVSAVGTPDPKIVDRDSGVDLQQEEAAEP